MPGNSEQGPLRKPFNQIHKNIGNIAPVFRLELLDTGELKCKDCGLIWGPEDIPINEIFILCPKGCNTILFDRLWREFIIAEREAKH